MPPDGIRMKTQGPKMQDEELQLQYHSQDYFWGPTCSGVAGQDPFSFNLALDIPSLAKYLK